MNAVALLGLGLFMVTSLIVSVRLFALARQTREVPELLLATALLCVGFLAFAVGTAAKLLVTPTEARVAAFTALGLSIECVGVLSLVGFAWRVFHPYGLPGRLVAGSLFALVATAFVGEVGSGEYLRYADGLSMQGPYVPFGLAARSLGPLWVSFECFRYHAKLRRRLRIGLAEPFVVHRVALWGVALGASFAAYVTSFAHRMAYGTGIRFHAWAIGTISLMATVTAVGIALAYFPPERYRAWVVRKGETREDG